MDFHTSLLVVYLVGIPVVMGITRAQIPEEDAAKDGLYVVLFYAGMLWPLLCLFACLVSLYQFGVWFGGRK